MENLSKIEKILSLVQKPARYINSELNSHTADISADLSVALCFPDIHEVGALNLELVKRGIASTCFKETTFPSLSCGNYTHLDKLFIETNNLRSSLKLNVSLPSLWCNKYSLKVVQYIYKSKRPTLIFAPEAGSDRLRNVIGKYLSEKQIVETLLTANAMSLKAIELYFMICLPTERDEDLSEIERLVKLIKKEAKELSFTTTVSPFVPKPQTAFQWVSMANAVIIKQKIDFLHKLLPDIKPYNHKASVLEALIATGYMHSSKIIYKAWQKDVDLGFYVYRNISPDEVFPWSHLLFGISNQKLYKDYVKGINETVNNLVARFDKLNHYLPVNYIKPKMPVLPPVMRLRLRFSKKGVVKFMSHLEQIEVFRKAAKCSNLPVAFTTGTSPQVKSSFGPPLSVGQESISEYMELYFTQKIDVAEVKKEFIRILPKGFKLLSVKRIPLNFPPIDVLSNVVEYKIKGIEITQTEIDKFLMQDSIMIEKIKKRKIVTVNAKPLIREFFAITNGTLKLQLRFGSGKTVKPGAVINKLLENKENYGKIYAIERTNLYIETKNGNLFLP